MADVENDADASERRRIGDSRRRFGALFCSIVFGIAVQEAVSPVREDFRHPESNMALTSQATESISVPIGTSVSKEDKAGTTSSSDAIARPFSFPWVTLSMAIVFFLTSLRFLWGNEEHLSAISMNATGHVWFLDFFVVAFEGLLIIFLGGLCSKHQSLDLAYIGFYKLLTFIYLLDIVWIAIVQARLGKWIPHFKREGIAIPWKWLKINTLAVLWMFCVWLLTPGTVYEWQISSLLIACINARAFYQDVGYLARGADDEKKVLEERALIWLKRNADKLRRRLRSSDPGGNPS
jgi:hypothetical protein